MELWLTAGVLALLVVVLVREVMPPAAAVLGALVTLVLTGVVTPTDGFAGFSASATITIAGLFVLARAVEDHVGLERALSRLLGDGARHSRTLAALLLPVATLSAVIANTPLVAGMAPMVRTWAERNGRSPSRYLMPLSFAAILGGTVTTIGTSTILVVSGLVETQLGEPLGFLEVTPIGLPVAVLGTAALIVLAPRLLPERTTPEASLSADERDYTFRLAVEPGGPVDGRTVAEAALRNLADVYVAEVDREGRRIVPVAPDTVLRGGDELVFVGRVRHVRSLATARPGLSHAQGEQARQLDGDRHGLHEAVIGRSSRLLGRTLKEVSFRGRYGAAVLAIHRAGARVDRKLGEVRLEAGDVLLLQAGSDFTDRWRGGADFAVVAPLDEVLTGGSRRAGLVSGTGLGMILLAATGVLPLLHAVLLACAVLLGTGTLRFSRAKEALDIDVLLIIASAIGLGAAVRTSGLADLLGDAIVAVSQSGGQLAALGAVVLGTLVLTELVTNVAAAALMVPIALSTATAVDADPRAYALAVAVAASTSLLTPIGYQTNTMVYGLGGYRFGDFWRLGLPLSLLTVTVVLVAVSLGWV